jgi:hypothetical protein
VYYVRFDSFPPPSALNDSELVQMAVGAVVLSVVGTVVIGALDRWWHSRRPGWSQVEQASASVIVE